MEYIGGESLRQIALAHKDSDGRRHAAAAGPRARLRAGSAARHGLSAQRRPAVLRSQAGQRDPDRRAGEADRPRRRAARGRHDQPDLLHLRLQRAGDRRRRARRSRPTSTPSAARWPCSASTSSATPASTGTRCRPPKQVPLFSLFGSYHRLLRRATHPDPDRRFGSAEDMADQLTGVLREVLSLGTREPRPGRSTVFGPEVRTFGAELVRPAQRQPVASPAPPDWADVVELPAGAAGGHRRPGRRAWSPASPSAVGSAPANVLDALRAAPPTSMEAKLWRARALLELGELNQASRELAEAAAAGRAGPADAGRALRLADQLVPGPGRAGRPQAAGTRGWRSSTSTTWCRANWRRSWRWRSAPSAAVTTSRPPGSTSWCGAPTGPS